MAKKVMVAMSGGVDSSVAAALLLDAGYEVCGATLRLFSNEDIGICDRTRTCCSLDDVQDARSVAYKLNFPHHVFNYGMHFEREVIRRFANGYASGATPNPCIDCNRFIKFSLMLERAMLLENDYIATGHYAQTEYNEKTGRWLLKKGVDDTKDQTYVLYALTQHELAHTLFPLSGMPKSKVREIALERGLVNARKPDSQDICFVKDGDYAGFLENVMNIPNPHGNFVDAQGNVLGQHKGILRYTIGQRKGLGLSLEQPHYVVAKDVETNTVTLGLHEELFSNTLEATDLNWISIASLQAPMRVQVKARYKQQQTPGTIIPLENGNVKVEFDTPQRAITPGQAVVFYEGDYVVGGGTIL